MRCYVTQSSEVSNAPVESSSLFRQLRFCLTSSVVGSLWPVLWSDGRESMAGRRAPVELSDFALLPTRSLGGRRVQCAAFDWGRLLASGSNVSPETASRRRTAVIASRAPDGGRRSQTAVQGGERCRGDTATVTAIVN